MQMADVLPGGPHCAAGTVQKWTAPQPGSGLSASYHILLARTQATAKEAGNPIVFRRNGLEEASGVTCCPTSPLVHSTAP